MHEDYKSRVLGFLGGQKLAVISTNHVRGLSPESALIAFVEAADLCIYFQTGVHTRKAINLEQNPHTSLVFGLSAEDLVTVQYEGIASQLKDPSEIAACEQRFRAKRSPTSQEYLDHPSTVLYRVTPTWIGCSDYSNKKSLVFEIKDIS